MAGTDRTTPGAVELAEALEEAPYRFDFFQVVRYLERVNKDKPRIGRSARPVDDAIRFGQDPSLGFAPSAVASYTPAKNGRPAKLNGHFFGLLGPNGPLPTHLTEYAYGRLHNDHDDTFAAFLDVFHHRMISLFYRAWANSRPAVSFDRPDADWFGAQLGAVLGIGMESLRNRDAMPDAAKLHYAGLLACQTRHPGASARHDRRFFQTSGKNCGVCRRLDGLASRWLLPTGNVPRNGNTGRDRDRRDKSVGMSAQIPHRPGGPWTESRFNGSSQAARI